MWISLQQNKLVTREITLVGLSRASETHFKVWDYGIFKGIVGHQWWSVGKILKSRHSVMAKTKTFNFDVSF